MASVFAVCDGLVTSLVRYDDLPQALKTAGLDQSDEIGSEHRARLLRTISPRARRGSLLGS